MTKYLLLSDATLVISRLNPGSCPGWGSCKLSKCYRLHPQEYIYTLEQLRSLSELFLALTRARNVNDVM